MNFSEQFNNLFIELKYNFLFIREALLLYMLNKYIDHVLKSFFLNAVK